MVVFDVSPYPLNKNHILKFFHENDRGLKVFEKVSSHDPSTSLKVPKYQKTLIMRV